MLDVENIRKDFPILKRKINGKPLIYFDNAATSAKPVQVIEAIKDYYENYNANIHRSIHTLGEEATRKYEEAREKVRKFINARSTEEIIFVRNTTEAINLFAYAWGFNNLKKGDEIISSVIEHHSNIVPWQFLSNKIGVKVKYVDINEDGLLKMDDYSNLITRNTRLVAVTHASNVLGTINDVKEIGRIAHENDCIFLVDGAQSTPHFKIDVQEIDADVFVFSGHKMLAPMGIGVLYCKKEILEKMEPFMHGSEMIKTVTLEGFTVNDLPLKYEAGTSNVEGAIGLAAAIDYLNNIGMENIRRYEESLTEYALKRLLEIDWVEIYGPKDFRKRVGVISFNVKDVHSHDVAQILDWEGIAIRSGHMCAMPLMKRLGVESVARASFYIYNTKEEIDKFIEALHKVKEILG